MRKIERLMNEAVNEALNWKSGNTEVKTDLSNNSRVFLHGNHIATVGGTFMQIFDGGWQSNWKTRHKRQSQQYGENSNGRAD